MKVLVINCGSSSLKYQLIETDTENVLVSGLCERIGIDGRLVYKPANGEKRTFDDPLPDHKVGISNVISALTNPEYGVIKEMQTLLFSRCLAMDSGHSVPGSIPASYQKR